MLELRDVDPSGPQQHRVTVRDVLAFAPLHHARLIAGEHGLDGAVTGINAMQVPTDRFAKQGALLLAGISVFTDLEQPEQLFRGLIKRRVGGLAIRGIDVEQAIGASVVELAERRALPLIQLPTTVHLGQLMTDLLGMLVENQYRTLRSAGDVRAELSGYVLSGGSLDGLPDAIASLLGGDVALLDAEGHLLAASQAGDIERATEVARAWLERPNPSPAEVVGEGWLVWPVTAGPERLGALVARADPARSELVFPTLQHGSSNAALQILQEREALAADAGLRQRFFRDLLYGSVDGEAAQRRAVAIGLSAESYRVVLILGSPVSEADAAVALHGGLVVRHGEGLLGVLPSTDAAIAAVSAVLPEGHAGISTIHHGLDELPSAVADATEALAAARMFDREVRFRRFDELGPLRLLARIGHEELRRFAEDVLRPLDHLSEDTRSTLLETLEVLLCTGLNVAETARRGGWHYNTVRYRVARLTELIGPLFTDGTLLESLSLAMLLDSILGAEDGREAGALSTDPVPEG